MSTFGLTMGREPLNVVCQTPGILRPLARHVDSGRILLKVICKGSKLVWNICALFVFSGFWQMCYPQLWRSIAIGEIFNRVCLVGQRKESEVRGSISSPLQNRLPAPYDHPAVSKIINGSPAICYRMKPRDNAQGFLPEWMQLRIIHNMWEIKAKNVCIGSFTRSSQLEHSFNLPSLGWNCLSVHWGIDPEGFAWISHWDVECTLDRLFRI